MEHKGTKRIETERLILRKVCEKDIEPAYKNWTSDNKVTEYLTWPTHSNVGITANVFRDWISKYENKDYYHWVIELRELNEPIGTIGVVELKESIECLHIGYCIGSKWWNKGIVTEAFSAIIPYLFDEVKANKLESRHDPNNPNSGKVMEKCGLRYEGTLRKADISNKGIVDASYYSLLADEYYEDK